MLFVANGGNILKASCISGEKGREKRGKGDRKREREGETQGTRKKKGREICVPAIVNEHKGFFICLFHIDYFLQSKQKENISIHL